MRQLLPMLPDFKLHTMSSNFPNLNQWHCNFKIMLNTHTQHYSHIYHNSKHKIDKQISSFNKLVQQGRVFSAKEL